MNDGDGACALAAVSAAVALRRRAGRTRLRMRAPEGSYAENLTPSDSVRLDREIGVSTSRLAPLAVENWRARRSLSRFFDRERFADPGDLEIADDPEGIQDLQGDPGDVELVPGEAVARRHRVRV